VKAAEANCLKSVFFGLLAAGLSLATLAYPGTPDMQDFLNWASVLAANGPVSGYRLIADYPPLGPAFIWAAVAAGRFAAIPDLISLKLAIGLFQLIAAAIAAWRFRSLNTGALLFLLVAPYGTLLGYIDCFYLPFVLLAVFALEAKAFGLAGTAIAVAVLIKWQPAILAPFMFIYALSQASGWRKLTGLLPGAVIGLAVIGAFGPASVLWAFGGAASDPYFSGQAFNLDWIISAGLEYFHLAGAPALATGSIVAITALAPPWFGLSKILFWAAYLAVLAVFTLAGKTMTRLYLALAAAESVQFTLNTGVHENHAFLLMVLVFLAVRAGALKEAFLPLVALVAISNILLFYGLNMVTGSLASLGTLLLAGLDVLICIGLVSVFVRACRPGASGAASPGGSG
jgi:hypothetical protein